MIELLRQLQGRWTITPPANRARDFTAGGFRVSLPDDLVMTVDEDIEGTRLTFAPPYLRVTKASGNPFLKLVFAWATKNVREVVLKLSGGIVVRDEHGNELARTE
jgi:hypothetical protein